MEKFKPYLRREKNKEELEIEFQDNCFFHATKDAISGFAYGALIGGISGFVTGIRDKKAETTKQKFLSVLKNTSQKAVIEGFAFALSNMLSSYFECSIEKYRGKTDVWNGLIAGCITGATLSAKDGPNSALKGCLSAASLQFFFDSINRK
ncbi:import inner membrane translocase subunit tim22 [Anaeramoeba ignava]|uniref:Mitochondrial import inner membrane translocase subunit TIM22 n=1 Tax=Anaeramoeba ignava TaxID=1746090 RepID=A0A9Q0LLN0_ANAIG|nr:import inner membrane translocase subunit tim22 [Anaeramoeba ignava]|eukprot:Anaeramoba_ignava/a484114_67.p1 GENE.a484114_67~~a484114_67.p1  ORF type:complete len:150 (+),score=45.62 a484114_67:20-469(+)